MKNKIMIQQHYFKNPKKKVIKLFDIDSLPILKRMEGKRGNIIRSLLFSY